MIEGGWRPPVRRMAEGAVGWITGRLVGWVRRTVEVLVMARVAVRGRGHVVIVGVALCAGNRGVFPRKRPMRVQSMIEFGIRPVEGRMANPAVPGQRERDVGRIGRTCKIGTMARIALRRRPLKDIVDMTGSAGQRGVRPGQRVAGVLQMVELGAEPGIHGVATLTRCGELEAHVIDDRGEEVFLVAAIACRGKTDKLSGTCILVALVALYESVGSDKGETVLVLLDRLGIHLPAFNGMAVLAIRSELPPVNVCVTIRALGAHVFEDHTRVALRACHLIMHSAQRIARLIVIKFRIGADRLPARISVAILAGSYQRTMRISDLGLRSFRRACLNCFLLGRLTVHRRPQRHARKHGHQAKGCRNEPTCAVHLSLRAIRACVPA